MRLTRLVLPLLLAAGISLAFTGPAAAKGTPVRPLDDPITVTLSAGPSQLWPTMTTTLTATTNVDIGPTDYYVSIYDLTDQSYVTSCGSGSTCTVGVTHKSAGTTDYVAYVALEPGYVSVPPSGEVAASAQVPVNWFDVSVSLASNTNETGVNGTVTVTATTSRNVGSSPFYTEIYDVTGGTSYSNLVGYCDSGTSCSVNVTSAMPKFSWYVAYVAPYGSTTTPPAPPLEQARSNQITVTWIRPGQ